MRKSLGVYRTCMVSDKGFEHCRRLSQRHCKNWANPPLDTKYKKSRFKRSEWQFVVLLSLSFLFLFPIIQSRLVHLSNGSNPRQKQGCFPEQRPRVRRSQHHAAEGWKYRSR